MRRPAPTVCLSVLLGYSGMTGWLPSNGSAVDAHALYVESSRMLEQRDDLSSPTRQFDSEDWVPRRDSAQIRQEYLDIVRDIEFRQRYSLASREDLASQNRQQKKFARYYAMRAASIKAGKELRKLDRKSGGAVTRTMQGYKKAVAAVQKPLAVSSSGGPLQYGYSVSLLEMNGKTWFTSSVLSGDALYQFDHPWVPPLLQRQLDPVISDERWAFALYRRLPFWNTETRLSYGTTSARFRFSLVEYFSAQLRSEYQYSTEHSVRIYYAVRL